MTRVLVLAALLLAVLPSVATAAEGGGGLINLDKSLVIQAINFLLLLAIMVKLLWTRRRPRGRKPSASGRSTPPGCRPRTRRPRPSGPPR